MHYKFTTNELWMDYKVMDGNPCEWTPFIMWACPILAFLLLLQRKKKNWLNLSLRHDVSWQGWNTFPHKMGHMWELKKKIQDLKSIFFLGWGVPYFQNKISNIKPCQN
jgi:hypothetical protein